MKSYCNDGCGFSVLLNAIMITFPSAHVNAFADAYPNLIREVTLFFSQRFALNFCFRPPKHLTLVPQTTDEIVPRSQLFASLGTVCCDSSPAADKVLPILNDVWKSVSRVEDCVQ